MCYVGWHCRMECAGWSAHDAGTCQTYLAARTWPSLHHPLAFHQLILGIGPRVNATDRTALQNAIFMPILPCLKVDPNLATHYGSIVARSQSSPRRPIRHAHPAPCRIRQGCGTSHSDCPLA